MYRCMLACVSVCMDESLEHVCIWKFLPHGMMEGSSWVEWLLVTSGFLAWFKLIYNNCRFCKLQYKITHSKCYLLESILV